MNPCVCLPVEFPADLEIRAGLDALPRQIGGFPDFRGAMLSALRGHSELKQWRARDHDDLGVMWLEMWAYVCDILSLYDEVIANEAYLRTSRRPRSLRGLVGLLGYHPRPGAAAFADLALLAEGGLPVALPRGTAFRSGAFDDEPPQVFELEADTLVVPQRNRFEVEPTRPNAIGTRDTATDINFLLLEPEGVRATEGEPLLITVGDDVMFVRTPTSVENITGRDGAGYVRVEFDHAISILNLVPLQSIRLWVPGSKAPMWIENAGVPWFFLIIGVGGTNSSPATPASARVHLDALYRDLEIESFVLVSRGGVYRPFRVVELEQEFRSLGEPDLVSNIPQPRVPVSVLGLDTEIDGTDRKGPDDTATWASLRGAELSVHYDMQLAGRVTLEADLSYGVRSTLTLRGPLIEPVEGRQSTAVFLEDRHGRGVREQAEIEWDDQRLSFARSGELVPALATPLEVFGNSGRVTRGETVEDEVLGSGDAALSHQTLKLAKKPLTYVPSSAADDARGVASTLRIWVDGIEWSEAKSFFGRGPEDRIFLVRQDDEQETWIHFGDGQRGARLTTGTDNVIASYRFGAGATNPPAGGITQLASAADGISGVRNPVAAAGGADPESPESLRSNAPRVALLLGRIVSASDFQAVADGYPGVRAAAATWTFSEILLDAVARVAFAGPDAVRVGLLQTLRGLADETTPVEVHMAQPLPRSFRATVVRQSEHRADRVRDAVLDLLMAVPGDVSAPGLLRVEQLGIGRPVYRSQLLAAIQAVSGVVRVAGLEISGSEFDQWALSPGEDRYFDFEAGEVDVVVVEVGDHASA